MNNVKLLNEFLRLNKSFKMDGRAKEVLKKLLNNIDIIDVIKYGDHKRRVNFSEKQKEEKEKSENTELEEEKENEDDKQREEEDKPGKDVKQLRSAKDIKDVKQLGPGKDVKQLGPGKDVKQLSAKDIKDVKQLGPGKDVKQLGPGKLDESDVLFFGDFVDVLNEAVKLSSKVKNIGKSDTQSKKNIKVEVIKNTEKSRDWRVFQSDAQNYVLVINGQHFIDSKGKSTVNPKLVKIYWKLLDELSQLQTDYKHENITKNQLKSSTEKLKQEILSELK